MPSRPPSCAWASRLSDDTLEAALACKWSPPTYSAGADERGLLDVGNWNSKERRESFRMLAADVHFSVTNRVSGTLPVRDGAFMVEVGHGCRLFGKSLEQERNENVR